MTKSRRRILLIEDDEDVAQAVRAGLSPEEFDVDHAGTLASAEDHLRRFAYRALVVDLTLPDGDGLELARRLRDDGVATPILMLTARDSLSDRLAGFEHGADDYLGKPFDVTELGARLRAVMRRADGADRHILNYEDLELNLLTRKAQRAGQEVHLSDREAELLAFMMRRASEVLSREYLLEELWGTEVGESSNLVNVYINLLRNKIDLPNCERLIHTVRGVGYVLARQAPDNLP